jgi:hypothetical protein
MVSITAHHMEYKYQLVQLQGPKCNINNRNGYGKYFPQNMLSIDPIVPISMGGAQYVTLIICNFCVTNVMKERQYVLIGTRESIRRDSTRNPKSKLRLYDVFRASIQYRETL